MTNGLEETRSLGIPPHLSHEKAPSRVPGISPDPSCVTMTPSGETNQTAPLVKLRILLNGLWTLAELGQLDAAQAMLDQVKSALDDLKPKAPEVYIPTLWERMTRTA